MSSKKKIIELKPVQNFIISKEQDAENESSRKVNENFKENPLIDSNEKSISNSSPSKSEFQSPVPSKPKPLPAEM